MTKRYFTEGDAASGSVLSETCGDIQELERAMNEAHYILKPTLDDYLETDREIRRIVEEWIG